MTPALWYFLRLRPGELRGLPSTRVPPSSFERGGILLAGEDGFVRYVEVTVLLEARRAVECTASRTRSTVSMPLGGEVDRRHEDGYLLSARALVGLSMTTPTAFPTSGMRLYVPRCAEALIVSSPPIDERRRFSLLGGGHKAC